MFYLLAYRMVRREKANGLLAVLPDIVDTIFHFYKKRKLKVGKVRSEIRKILNCQHKNIF